jgi:hypothetical protein
MLSSTRHDIFILLFIYTFEQHIPRAYFGRRSDILRILFPFLLGKDLISFAFSGIWGYEKERARRMLGIYREAPPITLLHIGTGATDSFSLQQLGH